MCCVVLRVAVVVCCNVSFDCIRVMFVLLCLCWFVVGCLNVLWFDLHWFDLVCVGLIGCDLI